MSDIVHRSNPNQAPYPKHWMQRAMAVGAASLALLGVVKGGDIKTAVHDALVQDPSEYVVPASYTEEYTVRPGDNPWKIARDVVGHEGAIEPVVTEITQQARAHDGDTLIHAGDTLHLPELPDGKR